MGQEGVALSGHIEQASLILQIIWAALSAELVYKFSAFYTKRKMGKNGLVKIQSSGKIWPRGKHLLTERCGGESVGAAGAPVPEVFLKTKKGRLLNEKK